MQLSRFFAALALVAACTSSADEAAPQWKSLQAGECHGDSDCTSVESCVLPDHESVCGGAGCPPDECNADIDCATQGLGEICISIDNVRLCRPGCGSDNPCEAHEDCAADGHCTTKQCSIPDDCPADFDCGGGLCRRRECADDSPCDGYCVAQLCYATPGACEAPAP